LCLPLSGAKSDKHYNYVQKGGTKRLIQSKTFLGEVPSDLSTKRIEMIVLFNSGREKAKRHNKSKPRKKKNKIKDITYWPPGNST